MYLNYWGLSALAFIWIASYIHGYKNAKMSGIILGLNYVLDSMNFSEKQKREYILKCLRERHNTQ